MMAAAVRLCPAPGTQQPRAVPASVSDAAGAPSVRPPSSRAVPAPSPFTGGSTGAVPVVPALR